MISRIENFVREKLIILYVYVIVCFKYGPHARNFWLAIESVIQSELNTNPLLKSSKQISDELSVHSG